MFWDWLAHHSAMGMGMGFGATGMGIRATGRDIGDKMSFLLTPPCQLVAIITDMHLTLIIIPTSTTLVIDV
ncbi:MAG: hypothetical protein WC785_04470 [Tatlockia sp.]